MTEFLCLAYSRKHGGACIAGFDLDAGRWIRPVSAEGRLLQEDYAGLRRNPRVLDTIRLPLSEARPMPFQPENWLIGPGDWRLGDPNPPEFLRQILLVGVSPGPQLLGDTSSHVAAGAPGRRPGTPSLALVEPRDPRFEVGSGFRGNTQLRAHFFLGPAHYNLVVTDMEWELMALALTPGEYAATAFGVPQGTRLLFTVSLGEPTTFDGASYKIVAAVIPLP